MRTAPRAITPASGGHSVADRGAGAHRDIRRTLVRALDALIFGTAGVLGEEGPRPPRTWRRLEGGPAARSALWRVQSGGTGYVVKVYRSPLRDAPREAWADRWLTPGIAPSVLAVLGPETRTGPGARALAPHGAVVVMSDVGGRRCPSTPARWVLEGLARRVAALHEARPRGGPASVLPSDPTALGALAARWLEELATRRRSSRAEVRAIEGQLASARRRAARSALFARPVRRLLHGDLRFENVRLVGREARLVDLEHAGLGDPALDLALLVWRAPLSPDQERTLLETYLGATRDRSVVERYRLLLPLVALAVELGLALDRDDATAPASARRTRSRSGLGPALDRLAGRVY